MNMDITQGGALNATDLNEIIDLTSSGIQDFNRKIEPPNPYVRIKTRNHKTMNDALNYFYDPENYQTNGPIKVNKKNFSSFDSDGNSIFDKSFQSQQKVDKKKSIDSLGTVFTKTYPDLIAENEYG